MPPDCHSRLGDGGASQGSCCHPVLCLAQPPAPGGRGWLCSSLLRTLGSSTGGDCIHIAPGAVGDLHTQVQIPAPIYSLGDPGQVL